MVTALLVLVIAYFGFIAGSDEISIYSDASEVGDKVLLQGEVVGKRATFTGGHLLLNVESGGSIIRVFVHRNSGAGQVNLSVAVEDEVEILGTVDEYEGEKEIIVENAGDIRILK